MILTLHRYSMIVALHYYYMINSLHYNCIIIALRYYMIVSLHYQMIGALHYHYMIVALCYYCMIGAVHDCCHTLFTMTLTKAFLHSEQTKQSSCQCLPRTSTSFMPGPILLPQF